MFRGQGRGEAPPRWKPEGTFKRRMDISEDRWDLLSGPSVTPSESHLSSTALRCISRRFYVVYVLKAGNWKPRRGFTDLVPAPCRRCLIVGRMLYQGSTFNPEAICTETYPVHGTRWIVICRGSQAILAFSHSDVGPAGTRWVGLRRAPVRDPVDLGENVVRLLVPGSN